jgi:ABC-type multidrug transport system fused ATPase/permease subunit
MKATTGRQPSSLAARTLKIVGILLVISSLLDFLVLPFPYSPLDLQWRLQLAESLVERGIIPMIGLAMLFAGFWIDNSTAQSPQPQKSWQDLRFWGLWLASLLGLFFLLIFPMHLNDTRIANAKAMQLIERQAEQQEQQLENLIGSQQFQQQLEQRQSQFKQQLSQRLEDEDWLQQRLQSEEVPEQEKNMLQEFKENPEAIDQFLSQRVQQLPDVQRTRIREQKLQRQQQAKMLWKSGLRISLSSLLLAIGYITIGWSGLQRMMGRRRANRRQPSAS